MLFTLLILIITAFIYGVFLFIFSRFLGNRNDFADVAWGSIFVVLAIVAFGINNEAADIASAKGIVLGLVLVWAIRISYSVGKRFLKAKNVDPRYSALSGKWHGNANLNAFLRIFLTQPFLALVIVLPVVFSMTHDLTVTPLLWIGTALWLFGFVFELIGDKQLAHFLGDSKNKGMLMTSGLWHYSRHPNYFGEVTQWWALGLIATTVTWGWLSLIGPLLLTFLIMKVSGVPLAEARNSEKTGWTEYKQRTSVLFPLPPKTK